MLAGLAYVISCALINVLNRKMKSVHFSIIQFDNVFFSWFTLFFVILVEYLVLHSDEKRYPYPTLRILTYNFEQWMLLFVYAISNFFV